MLERVTAWLGKAPGGFRPDTDTDTDTDTGTLAIVRPGGDLSTPDATSPGFAHGSGLPSRFTIDGQGVSLPLVRSTPPASIARPVLIVEFAVRQPQAIGPCDHLGLGGRCGSTDRMCDRYRRR